MDNGIESNWSMPTCSANDYHSLPLPLRTGLLRLTIELISWREANGSLGIHREDDGLMRIGFQLSGALGKYLTMLSSRLILPSSTRIIMAAETNCLPTEPDSKTVSGFTGTDSSTFAVP